MGKVGDTNQSCPYNESYKKCVCNPCGGYDYTAAQASAQGYTPGEVCNSCGTMKYKRSANACDEEWRRAQRCSVARSSSVNSIATVGRPACLITGSILLRLLPLQNPTPDYEIPESRIFVHGTA